MNFADWCETGPDEIRMDRVWRIKVYQLAMFAAEIGWTDVTKLAADRRTLNLSDQLYRSIGSIVLASMSMRSAQLARRATGTTKGVTFLTPKSSLIGCACIPRSSAFC